MTGLLSFACMRLGMIAIAGAAIGSPPGKPTLDVRLETRLSSFTARPGTPFSAVAISAVERDGKEVIPRGTQINGVVRKVTKVGLGLIHERASLELEFKDYELADGSTYPLQAELVGIDNAREEVLSSGRIKGVLAAANPHSFIQGIWWMPSHELAERSVMWMTGTKGALWAQTGLGPIAAAGVLVARLVILRLPEAEINLPAGTDLKLRVLSIPDDAPVFEAPAPAKIEEELADSLAGLPYNIQRQNGSQNNDIVNLAFLGTRAEVKDAFTAAGWSRADRLTPGSVRKSYKAWTSKEGYATAPVSMLTYQGRKPDLVFQRSMNTFSKRHHIRIWHMRSGDGGDVWVGAATHDVALAFDRHKMKFTHRIDLRVDLERSKVIDDLDSAGCTQGVMYLERPALEAPRGVRTDGALAVAPLRGCKLVERVKDKAPGYRMPLLKLVRRITLEMRNYVLRGNIWYWGYRALRWSYMDLIKRDPGIEE